MGEKQKQAGRKIHNRECLIQLLCRGGKDCVLLFPDGSWQLGQSILDGLGYVINTDIHWESPIAVFPLRQGPLPESEAWHLIWRWEKIIQKKQN